MENDHPPASPHPPLRQKTSNSVRLGMINNPSESPSSEGSRVARAMWATMQTQTANNAMNFITKLTKEETAAALESGAHVTDFAVGVSKRSTTRPSGRLPDGRRDDRPLDLSVALLLVQSGSSL